MPRKPLRHHEVLLEVILEWEVDEWTAQSGQLERGGASALDYGHIASGEVFLEVRGT